MIHLNALDFNVCRFEEVISFFWHSAVHVCDYVQREYALII